MAAGLLGTPGNSLIKLEKSEIDLLDGFVSSIDQFNNKDYIGLSDDDVTLQLCKIAQAVLVHYTEIESLKCDLSSRSECKKATQQGASCQWSYGQCYNPMLHELSGPRWGRALGIVHRTLLPTLRAILSDPNSNGPSHPHHGVKQLLGAIYGADFASKYAFMKPDEAERQLRQILNQKTYTACMDDATDSELQKQITETTTMAAKLKEILETKRKEGQKYNQEQVQLKALEAKKKRLEEENEKRKQEKAPAKREGDLTLDETGQRQLGELVDYANTGTTLSKARDQDPLEELGAITGISRPGEAGVRQRRAGGSTSRPETETARGRDQVRQQRDQARQQARVQAQESARRRQQEKERLLLSGGIPTRGEYDRPKSEQEIAGEARLRELQEQFDAQNY